MEMFKEIYKISKWRDIGHVQFSHFKDEETEAQRRNIFFFFFKATQLVVEPELASGFLISWPWAFLILLH